MKLLYQYEYNWSEEGYYDFILSWAPNGTYSERCRYRGQRDENGNYTMFFWKLLAVQFAFVLAFEYFVFTVCRLIDIFVADVPPNVDIKIRRERYLAKQALLDNSLFKDEDLRKKAESSKEEVNQMSNCVVTHPKICQETTENEIRKISQKIKSSKSETKLSDKKSEKLLSLPILHETAEEKPTKNASTQTEETSLLSRKLNKKWTTFPFITQDQPKMPPIPSQECSDSSSTTSSDMFDSTQTQLFSNFTFDNFQKVSFYSALTHSSSSRSRLSSLSSNTESGDKEKIMRRKSLDFESGESGVGGNRKPRPRSWLESSKTVSRGYLKANKFHL